jgi:hypothetical protein
MFFWVDVQEWNHWIVWQFCLWGVSILLSIVVALTYIPTSNV